MASVFDILGTAIGALSLLYYAHSLYEFLKARQPLAQADRFDAALHDAHQRIDELERWGHLSESPAAAAVSRAALDRLNMESLRVRADAERYGPQARTVPSVIAHAVLHGINDDASRDLCALTKQVRGIRQRLDDPPGSQLGVGFRDSPCPEDDGSQIGAGAGELPRSG